MTNTKPTSLINIILLSLILIAVAISLSLHTLLRPVVTDPAGYIYYLPPKIGQQTFVRQLSEAKLVTYPRIFKLYLYLQTSELKAGEYHFPSGSHLVSIYRQVSSGTGLYYRPFTIIPGASFKQIKQQLQQAIGLTPLAASLSDAEIMQRLGAPILSPEGQFFPETYYYTRGDHDLALLKRAYSLMQSRLQTLWAQREAGLPYQTPYQALIAASLVEKEAYLNNERPMIAGVLINRLTHHMLLQFDPTVIYGLGDNYRGKIYKSDLQRDTPYNTYLHKGLPPTPIATPSADSLFAVLHPQHHRYYYFVARGDGSHVFNESLSAHKVAVVTANTKKISQPYFNQDKIQRLLQKKSNR